jgi:hypothetical protein
LGFIAVMLDVRVGLVKCAGKRADGQRLTADGPRVEVVTPAVPARPDISALIIANVGRL